MSYIKCLSNNSTEQCTLPYMKQLVNIIFGSKTRFINPTSQFYLAVILPIVSYGTTYNPHNAIYEKLAATFNEKEMKLVGAWFGIKTMAFEKFIKTDILYGIIAVTFVVLVIFCYSSSWLFTICVTLSLILSTGVAYFLYTVVMRIHFFPFLNLLSIVLIIAVGADDAFLFIYQFKKEFKKTSEDLVKALPRDKTDAEKSDKCLSTVKLVKNVQESLDTVLSHAAIAMLVTSITTAIAFYTNIITHNVVLKCFGIYAGTTMIINYLFVVTVLPATIILSKRRIKKSNGIVCFPKLSRFIKEIYTAIASGVSKAFISWIPQTIEYARFVVIPLTFAMIALCVYAVVKNPGIRLPEKNPMQLLRSSHPFEWFDENSNTYFDFTVGTRRRMNIIAIWGIKPTESASTIDPYSFGQLSRDEHFQFALSQNLLTFMDLVESVISLYGSNIKSVLWISRFVKWAQENNNTCNGLVNKTSVQKNVKLLDKCFVKFAQTQNVARLLDESVDTLDGPLYTNDGHFYGYFLITQSHYNFSIIFQEMTPFISFLHDAEDFIKNASSTNFNVPVMVAPMRVTLLYDLLDDILNGTGLSVLISLAVSTVVIALTTMHLALAIFSIISIGLVVVFTIAVVLWIGWTVNVMEATIIVLTIGLSFDYTLHFAVAFKIEGLRNTESVYSLVSVPVLLAAVSSFAAGLGLIGARTQPFYEIGLFLMIITTSSLVVALFVLPSFVRTFLISGETTRNLLNE